MYYLIDLMKFTVQFFGIYYDEEKWETLPILEG